MLPGDAFFQEGDSALLSDRKGRRYMITLQASGVFHSHAGMLPHGDIIGQPQGAWLRTSRGHTFLAFKPTLAEYAQHMPRSTQVVYPKDLGNVLVMADIFPGARVVEAGLGSGALTLALLRAVGESGCVVAYELRREQATQTLKVLGRFLPQVSSLTVRQEDIYLGIQEEQVDRIVLDLPEPWRVVSSAATSLEPGGIFLSFLPTVFQVHRLVQELWSDGKFQLVETCETLLRPWHVTRPSMRPEHRMVAHSGFITTARRCQPGGGISWNPWHGRPGLPEPFQEDEDEQRERA